MNSESSVRLFTTKFCMLTILILAICARQTSVRAADLGDLCPVGASKIDITPEYPVRLSGYGNRRLESAGVAQRLWAKALAIGSDDGDGAAVLITVENCGMTPQIANSVAKRLKETSNVRRERLVISVSHSHTAPCLTDWAPFIFGMDIPPEHQAHIDRYTKELTDKMVTVASEALNNRILGRLGWASGTVGFAANRRVLKEGKWTGFGVQADGPVDHSLPILAAFDREKKLIAVVANYACHCTTLGGDYNQIAGDWLGYAQEYIEAANPGCISLITIGCGADANPEPRASKLELCQQHGRAMADEVARLLKNDLQPLDTKIGCRLIQVALPLAPLPSKEQWQETAKQSGAPGYHARKYLERLEQGQEIPKSIAYPIGVWSFGDDLAMVFMGGEVVVDYVQRLKSEYDPQRLWVSAYCNDVCCYIPSKRILHEGGYEADFSMIFYARPTRFADDVEDLICDTVQKLMPHDFYADDKLSEYPGPKSPADALASITVKSGYEVELVAAEPLVEDPVAFDWGPDGRLWVAEMGDYPNGIEWQQSGDPLGVPGGRIKVLTDTDGDGRYDQASTFLDKLPFPNGIKVWRSGVLITAAPNILYAEDTDGDGRADKTEILFAGFVEGNQQHRANGMRWGLDNWLYLANGDSGGSVKSIKTGDSVAIGGRDLRIRPDDGNVDPQAGQSQFGRCRDDWGNWFGCNNANPMYHFAIEDHYLRRNPHFPPPEIRRHVPEQPGTAPVFPTSQTLARFNDFHTANRFTSACSVEIYRDQLLFGIESPTASPENSQFAGHVFICEPVHNLVHHEELWVRGTTFRSRRAADEQKSEFLASSDNWFRPVMARMGPDGALWIADMYRSVIEHPEWIPQVWQRKLDVRAGVDRGRIYRVFPKGRRPNSLIRLDQLSADLLVSALDTDNGVQRDLIHQMLLWKQDVTKVAQLQKLAQSSRRPQTRIQAACVLDGLELLSQDIAVQLLADPHPGVRRQAVRLSEPFLKENEQTTNHRFFASLEKLATDEDPFVRQQLAYSLGYCSDPRVGKLLAQIALRDQTEPYIVAAVMSSLKEDNLATVFADLIQASLPGQPPQNLVVRLVSMAGATSNQNVMRAVFRDVLSEDNGEYRPERVIALADVLDAVAVRLQGTKRAVADLLSDDQRQTLDRAFARSLRLATNENASDEDRCRVMRLLVHQSQGRESAVKALGELLVPRNSSTLQSATISTLSRIDHELVPDQLLNAWSALTPALRSQSLDSLLSRPSWSSRLLDAVESQQIPQTHIDAARRQQLERSANETLRQRAAALFHSTNGSRQQLVEHYQDVLKLNGSGLTGKSVFAKRCAACHRLEETGHVVGPDLAALTNRSPANMLIAVLDPNRAVEDKFLDYLATTNDGRQFTGILTSETGTSITLSQPEGKQVTLLRRDLDQLSSTGKSLMPEGVEKDISKQELADVFAYLRKFSPPPKEFPGNHPEVAHVRDDGSIHILAMNAKIYGPSLVFEETYRNLGWWSSPDDHAVWMLNVPRAGTFDVVIDYACDDATAGNRFVMAIGDQVLEGVVRGTGSWDNYHSKKVGQVKLPQGPMELVFRSASALRGPLIDLRAIRLEPPE